MLVEVLTQIAAGDELGDEVGAAVLLAVLEDVDDVRRVQPRQRRCLPSETLPQPGIDGGLRGEHLQGHGALQIGCDGDEHHTHPALTEHVGDPVAPDGVPDLREPAHGTIPWRSRIASRSRRMVAWGNTWP